MLIGSKIFGIFTCLLEWFLFWWWGQGYYTHSLIVTLQFIAYTVYIVINRVIFFFFHMSGFLFPPVHTCRRSWNQPRNCRYRCHFWLGLESPEWSASASKSTSNRAEKSSKKWKNLHELRFCASFHDIFCKYLSWLDLQLYSNCVQMCGAFVEEYQRWYINELYLFENK